MKKSSLNPVVLIDDDNDDLDIFTEGFNSLNIENEIVSFNDAYKALDFIKHSGRQPLFILCDINMPKLDGLELRKKIYDDEILRQRCIPFLFLSTSDSRVLVDKAYDLSVQGYFKKPARLSDIKEMLMAIIVYWRYSHHPNSRSMVFEKDCKR